MGSSLATLVVKLLLRQSLCLTRGIAEHQQTDVENLTRTKLHQGVTYTGLASYSRRNAKFIVSWC